MFRKAITIATLLVVIPFSATAGKENDRLDDEGVKDSGDVKDKGSPRIVDEAFGGGGGGGGVPLVLPNFPKEFLQKDGCPPGSSRECVPPREQRHGDDD